MRVGFFTVFRKDPQHYVLAQALVRSVHATMPGVPLIHLTDDTSPQVLGTDAIVRNQKGPMLERRLEHYAQCEGDWLLVDTDVIIRQDVRNVWDDFDVALTDRAWPHLPQPEEVYRTMPFNTGVAFSRGYAFWRDVLKVWRATENKDWLSEQRAVWQVVRTGQYRVKILDGMTYNYPPKNQTDTLQNVAIAHYKGPRKEWMPCSA